MNLSTMAMQITEKNWSIAAAILGGEFAALPFPQVEGSFVIINTIEGAVRHGIRYGSAYSSRNNVLTMTNKYISAAEFQELFAYDKRTKNLETFFEVMQMKMPTVNEFRDPVDSKVTELVETYMENH